jgi:hypothetical protein
MGTLGVVTTATGGGGGGVPTAIPRSTRAAKMNRGAIRVAALMSNLSDFIRLLTASNGMPEASLHHYDFAFHYSTISVLSVCI